MYACLCTFIFCTLLFLEHGFEDSFHANISSEYALKKVTGQQFHYLYRKI